MLDSKYPQGEERFADTRNPLRDYDFDEEDLLNDLDQTSEVEKLRQQNFKLYRVRHFYHKRTPILKFQRITRLETKMVEQNWTLTCWSATMFACLAVMGFYVVRRD